MQVKVVERAQNISIQEQEILRKEKELDSKVRKPAEAEKFRLEKIAEAERQKVVLEAEAEAEATALRGEAEAYAIEVKAKAEAEQMAKKADAWKEYKEAALVDMMLKVMHLWMLLRADIIFHSRCCQKLLQRLLVQYLRPTRSQWSPLVMAPLVPAGSPMRCWTSWAACLTLSRR